MINASTKPQDVYFCFKLTFEVNKSFHVIIKGKLHFSKLKMHHTVYKFLAPVHISYCHDSCIQTENINSFLYSFFKFREKINTVPDFSTVVCMRYVTR